MYALRSGETLRVECFGSDAQVPRDKIKAIRDLILQPRSPWISEVERTYLEGALEGRFKSVARDRFFVGWIGDEPVGNVHYGTAAGAPEIGLLAYVITAPSHRGKGISSILTKRAIDHFLAAGGVCIHLGTGNPGARRVYQRCGFRDYNGHVMRYLALAQGWEDLNTTYPWSLGPSPGSLSPRIKETRGLADVGAAKVRRGHWGDLARVAMLYVAPHRWFVKDYPERIYGHPAIVQTRCASILTSMMVNVTQRNGGLWVLENPAQRVVGAATLTRLDGTAQSHVPILDFLVASAYSRQASDLLAAAIEALRDAGTERLRVYLASCDSEKAEIVRMVGFQHEATLAGQFRAGDDRYDLEIYVRLLC